MKNANLLGASSCIKTVSFLVSRFTKLSMLESEEKLGSYKQKYEFPKVIHQDLDKLKFLESILTNQSIKRFIGIIVDVLGKQDHYIFIEKESNNKVQLFQSFQNLYTLWESISVPQVYSFNKFLEIIKNLLSLSKTTVYDSLKELICYKFLDEQKCSNAKRFLTGNEDMSLFEQADAYFENGILIPENYKKLNFRPLNVDFIPLNDLEELPQPILIPLSNAEKEIFERKNGVQENIITESKRNELENNRICCSQLLSKEKDKKNSIRCKCYS